MRGKREKTRKGNGTQEKRTTRSQVSTQTGSMKYIKASW